MVVDLLAAVVSLFAGIGTTFVAWCVFGEVGAGR